MKKLFGSILVGASLVLSVCGLAACDLIDINWGTKTDHVHTIEHVDGPIWGREGEGPYVGSDSEDGKGNWESDWSKKAKEATCTEDGIKFEYWHCIDPSCDQYFIDASLTKPVTEETVVARALGHDYKEIDRQEPTCKATGWIEYECQRENCDNKTDKNGHGHTYKQTLAKVDHKFENHANSRVSKEATCLTPEYTEYECDYGCNTWGDETVTAPANGHVWGELVKGEVATCTTPGTLDHYVCENCEITLLATTVDGHEDEDAVKFATDSKEFNTEINPDNHAWELKEANEATCEKAGNDAYYECQNDNSHVTGLDEEGEPDGTLVDADDFVIPAINHKKADGTWDVTLIEAALPTCDTDGYYSPVYKCNICGAFFAAEANEDGEGFHVVEKDGKLVSAAEGKIPAFGHVYPKWWGNYEKALEAFGGNEEMLKEFMATYVELELWEEDLHDQPAWATNRGSSEAATCTADGYTRRYCNLHGSYERTTIPATGHSWKVVEGSWDWKWDADYTKDPTVTVKVRCDVCGEEKTVTAVVTRIEDESKDPDCTNSGTITYLATVTLDDGSVEAEDGTMVKGTVVLTDEQSKTYDALGHDWEDGICTRDESHLRKYVVEFYEDEENLNYPWDVEGQDALYESKDFDADWFYFADEQRKANVKFMGWYYLDEAGEKHFVTEAFQVYTIVADDAEDATVKLYAEYVFEKTDVKVELEEDGNFTFDGEDEYPNSDGKLEDGDHIYITANVNIGEYGVDDDGKRVKTVDETMGIWVTIAGYTFRYDAVYSADAKVEAKRTEVGEDSEGYKFSYADALLSDSLKLSIYVAYENGTLTVEYVFTSLALSGSVNGIVTITYELELEEEVLITALDLTGANVLRWTNGTLEHYKHAHEYNEDGHCTICNRHEDGTAHNFEENEQTCTKCPELNREYKAPEEDEDEIDG